MHDGDVMLPEVVRRLVALETSTKEGLRDVTRHIDALRFVHADTYLVEREALIHRIEEVESDLAESKEDRKWMIRAIVVSILFPLVVAFGTALALGGGM